ncbi:MAG: nitroreductase family protein [Dehalococcoidales bacterium]|nr:nitroreductase family protein [Dehalococcoidales bacterium]
MDIFEVIYNRHSIRKYKPDPVGDEDLAKILEAARQAPSWKNSQCWRFIIINNQATKNALAECLPPHNPAANAIREAPLTVVACAEIGKSGYGTEEPETDKGDYWYMYDTGLAMEHIVLAAAALGLGTVHVGMFDAPKAAALLNVPAGYCVVAMTPLGYPVKPATARPRKEISEIVYYDKFGGTR